MIAASIAHAFAARVATAPDALALFDAGAQVTYRELDRRSARIAAALARRGITRGARVGVALDRSIDLVATLLAVWRLGALVVPIDPAWPAARRAAVAQDAELAAVIAEVVEEDGPAPLADGLLDEPALALYTSGSTGQPKAVVLAHRALLWRCHALALAMPYAAGDVACLRTPPTFIDAYAEILGPLLHGVPAFVAPHPLAPARLAELLARANVTRLLLVPSLLGVLLDAAPDLGARVPTLRIVAVSGEPLSAALARRFYAAAPRAQLVNIYGSTEVAGDATYAEIPAAVPDAIPIGRALPGIEVELVDGEILVGGPVVAGGYWKRPELTAARFDRGRFRTGDRARYQADGQLVLVGRVDDQVKIAGVRVELGEVERALLAHPAVRAAAAAVETDADRTRLVAAFVGDVEAPAVRAHLAAALPEAAIPSVLARLAEIPTNGHGKIDRKAIAARLAAPSAHVVVTDQLVGKLATWFGELAGRAAGPDDDLIAIGGDSLARLSLLVLLEREGWHLEHADLPRPLTATALAARLRAVEPTESAPVSTETASYPLTDFQRVMALESLANAGTAMWTDQVAYAVDGPLDAERFAAAWRDVTAAEPALRTAIERQGDELVQTVRDVAPFELAMIDARALDLEAYRQRVLAEEWTRLSLAFALDRAPLFAVALVAGAARCDVIFTYHHVILDGESARRVLRAVLDRYAGKPIARGESFASFVLRTRRRSTARFDELLAGYAHVAEPEPPAPQRYGDFAWRAFHKLIAWRASRAAARVRKRRKRLRGLLAAARLDPATYAGGDILAQPIAGPLGDAIAAWAARSAATPTAVWAAAYALHLARERATRDVMFGVVVGGRDARAAHAVGMLANCLPLRVRIDRATSARELAGAVARGLDELERLAHTPLLAIDIDPRAFLDTLFISWTFARDPAWRAEPAVRGGRGLTLMAPRTALILSPRELAIGARTFHRTDRIRRDVLELVEAMLGDAPVAELLGRSPAEAGMSVALPGL